MNTTRKCPACDSPCRIVSRIEHEKSDLVVYACERCERRQAWVEPHEQPEKARRFIPVTEFKKT